MHRNHFVHLAMVNPDGNISYHSYPRLIQYSEMDPLKTIGFKIYKGLKNLLNEVCDIPKQEFDDQPLVEFNQYSALFCSAELSQEPYEMVIVLSDGSRWKIDPNKTQKLCQLISPEQIQRFECIFAKNKLSAQKNGFEKIKHLFDKEMATDCLNLHEAGFKELDQCLRHYVKANIVTPL